jgi:RNA polymerase sigma-70 factor (ECF subfamily)
MQPTSVSLLDRLRHATPDAPEWQRLHDLYLPVIRAWLSHVPGLHNEADDLSQEVLVVLFRELPSFERRRHGSFRAWLRQITVNRIRTFLRMRRKQPVAGLGPELDQILAQLEDANSAPARRWDEEHDRHVLQALLAIVQADFEPPTWHAFSRFALDGVPAADVARELAISVGQVVQAKFRVLKRLREEAKGLTG